MEKSAKNLDDFYSTLRDIIDVAEKSRKFEFQDVEELILKEAVKHIEKYTS